MPRKEQQEGGDTLTIFHRTKIETAKKRGRVLAERNLPKEGDKLSSYTAEITETYKNQLAQSLAPYGADRDELAKTQRQAINDKKSSLEKKLAAAQQKERNLQTDYDELPTNDYQFKSTWWIYAVCIILSLGEAYLTRAAFSLYEHSSNLYQMFILVLFTVLYYFLTKSIIGIYKGTEAFKYKNWIRGGVAVIAIASFYTIAEMRSNRLVNIGETTLESVAVANPHPIPTWYFVSINLLFIVIGCYVTSLLPSDEDRQSNFSAKQLDRKLDAVRKEIEDCEAALDAVPNNLAAIDQRKIQQQADAINIRQRINALHSECINTLISENRIYRSDPEPSCFDEPIPTL